MSISGTENLKKVNDTKELIRCLKEVVTAQDLRQVIMMLQLLKQGSDSDEIKIRTFGENMWRIFFDGNHEKDLKLKSQCL